MDSCIKVGDMWDITELEPHKKYRLFLGSSDYACLTLTGLKQHGVTASVLKFNEDGEYGAWVVDDLDLIPPHYVMKECYSFKYTHITGDEEEVDTWLKIYDDEHLIAEIEAKEIRVYRAGEFGCLIYIKK